jgi:predicted nucleic acid-binding protein
LRAQTILPDRRPLFLDSAYVIALVNTRDQWHPHAVQWQARLALDRRPLLTTDLVLVEIADALAAVRFREHAARTIGILRASPLVEIVAVPQLMTDALDLYKDRPDKDWGLTDCASFVVMAERSLTEALTPDEHFRQAGFHALLLD